MSIVEDLAPIPPQRVSGEGKVVHPTAEVGTRATPEFEELINADVARVYRRIDIFEADGVTPYRLDVATSGGSISVDYTRNERRTCDLTLDNVDDSMSIAPVKLWYDKIIRVYRGLISPTDLYVVQIGEFTIDQAVAPADPSQIQVSGRDFTKKMLNAKFAQATTFVSTTRVDDALKGIAAAAGVTAWNIPTLPQLLGRDFAYERGKDRWTAFTDITTAFSLEAFFSAKAVLTVRPFVDPLTAPLSFSFKSGPDGNLANFTRTTNDSNIRNDIVVQGADNLQIPVWGQAENNEPSSPTSIAKLGRRTEVITSSLVTTNAQAQSLAKAYLKVSALENFQIDMDAIVVPFLEAGTAVEFQHVRHVQPTDPTRFLLISFTIPMELGTMQATAKRVTIVG